MEVIIRPTKKDASWLAARIIEKAIREKPHLTLGLATGRTMERLYAKLVRLHNEEDLDFSLVQTFNLDEYIGLTADDPNSYRYYMGQHLFNHVNIDIRNTFLPNGMSEDLAQECQDYEARIEERGGIDLQLVGIGKAGHIGFNEPLSALQSRTRAKALAPSTVEVNSTLFDDPKKMPRRAITMGVGTIIEARKIILLVTGDSKAGILAKAIEGPITSMVTASALQLHPDCTVIVDEEAGSLLEGQDYYRWIFENEPEWREFRNI